MTDKYEVESAGYPILQLAPIDNTEVMRIEKDRIWINPDIKVDEAARKVLDAMEQMYSDRYRQIWNEAIDAAAKDVDWICAARGTTQGDVIRRLKK